jgi:hypothetical protein
MGGEAFLVKNGARRNGKRRESEYTHVYHMERLFAREFFSDFSKSLRERGLRRKIFFGSEGEKKGLGGCFGFLVVVMVERR